jgi:hypothetical protein
MHKSFLITEEEKNSILGMHENATKKQYLMEASTTGCTQGHCDDGQGTFIFDDGTKYVGQFKGGYENGKGTYINKNGYMWSGEFKDGDPVGKTWDELDNTIQTTSYQYTTRDVIKNIQNKLTLKGFPVGNKLEDGKFGPDTARAALEALKLLPNKK